MGDSQTKQFGNEYVDQLMGQLDKKAPVYNKSLFVPAGGNTNSAWYQGANNANGLISSGGLTGGQRDAVATMGGVGQGYAGLGANGGLTGTQRGAMSSTKGLADNYGSLGSAYDPNSAAYKTLRQGAIDDTLVNVGAGLNASGRFGGGSYIDTASQGVGKAIAGLDYTNMQNNINNQYRSLDSQKGIYDTLFGQGQQGVNNQFGALAGQGATANSIFGMGQQGIMNKNDAIGQLASIGASQDANRTGQRLGEYDLWNRTQNADLDRLLKIGSGFGGGAVDAANQAPWWQQILGYVAGNAGNAARAWGGM